MVQKLGKDQQYEKRSALWEVVGTGFAALFLAACSSNDTREADAAAEAAAEQAAQEAAAREAEQQAQIEAQRALEVAAADAKHGFYFGFDSSSLTDESRTQVDAHIAALLGNNDSVRLEGHTDERGTREYNLALGERRANAVRDYMVANGGPTIVLKRSVMARRTRPHTAQGESSWRQNRRVEAQVIDDAAVTAVSIEPAIRAGTILSMGLLGFAIPSSLLARDYVDVEAERRAAEQAMTTDAAPVVAPATSYTGIRPYSVRPPWRNRPRFATPVIGTDSGSLILQYSNSRQMCAGSRAC